MILSMFDSWLRLPALTLLGSPAVPQELCSVGRGGTFGGLSSIPKIFLGPLARLWRGPTRSLKGLSSSFKWDSGRENNNHSTPLPVFCKNLPPPVGGACAER